MKKEKKTIKENFPFHNDAFKLYLHSKEKNLVRKKRMNRLCDCAAMELFTLNIHVTKI